MKTYKVTEQFIKEAYNAACDEWKQKLKDEFPEALKTQLEHGKWYKTVLGGIFNFNGKFDEDGDPLGCGINIKGSWCDEDGTGWNYNGGEKATQKEIETALINEAKKRGFKEGVKFKLIAGNIGTINQFNITKDHWFEYHDNELRIEVHGSTYTIFEDGKWAEVIKEQQPKTITIEGKTYKLTPID